MWIFSYYRLYSSLGVGIGNGLFAHSVWIGIASCVGFRTLWFIGERLIIRVHINILFNKNLFEFKQLLGPYGIRMANRAQADFAVKKSLAEVFESNPHKLQKNIEQLEMMDTLYKAGMQPDPESYHLHDLKLKYGRHRLTARVS